MVDPATVRPGMVVRSSDGEALGRVATVEHGQLCIEVQRVSRPGARRRVLVPLGHVDRVEKDVVRLEIDARTAMGPDAQGAEALSGASAGTTDVVREAQDVNPASRRRQDRDRYEEHAIGVTEEGEVVHRAVKRTLRLGGNHEEVRTRYVPETDHGPCPPDDAGCEAGDLQYPLPPEQGDHP